MQIGKLKKHLKRSRWFEGIAKNPIFVGGLALPFAVMITTNLKNGVSISILLACSLIPTVLLASLIGSKLPSWIAPILYTLFSMALVLACVPLILPISPEVADSLGVYVPILSINTILTTLCERYSKNAARPVMALVDAVTYSVGFALALCIISLLRELFGNNTIWGAPVALPIKISGFQIAFSGFLFVAFFSALFSFVRRTTNGFMLRRYNLEEAKTSSSSTANLDRR